MNNTLKSLLIAGVSLVAGIVFGAKSKKAQKTVETAEVVVTDTVNNLKSSLKKQKDEAVQEEVEEVKTKVTTEDGGDFPPVG